MADNGAMLVVGVIVVVLITAGLTYYITKSSAEQLPPQNQTNVSLEKPSITVRGEATKTVSPDLMVIGLTIDSIGANTSASQAQSAADTAKVKAALLAAGLEAGDIQTSSYYTYPVYNDSCYDYCYPYYGYDYAVPAGDGVYKGDAPASEPAMESGSGAAGSGVAYPDSVYPPDIYPRPCKSECNITGYKTSHVLMIKTDKVNDGGDIVDAALGAGDFKIDYIYFSVKDETRVKVESDLQAAAASNAKSKAQNIATGLGATLGKVISVTTDYYPVYPYPVYAYDRQASAGEAAPPTEIFPTDSGFSGSITVTYELEQ